MKIKNMQINAFGNIENKQIELSDGINVVYGKNEAGKSTLLKFIVDIFYGISKNKRGKGFSDYDRYKPWNSQEFSGKISYVLDSGMEFEVFRDFNKKNPVIYDKELNDISKQFTIDKTNGNQFFVEQTKIDEMAFLSTLGSMQQEVRLEKQEQNALVQRLANLTSTGDDNVSYKKAIDKIEKKQREEIGTSRSQIRPINILREEKFRLQDEIGELVEYKDKKYEIEEQRQELEEKVRLNEEKFNIVKDLKELQDKENVEKQKLEFNQNIIENNNKKIEKLQLHKIEKEEKLSNINQKKETKEYTQKSNGFKYIPCVIFMIISAIIGTILKSNLIVLIASISVFLISLITLIALVIIYNKKINKQEELMAKEVKEKSLQKQEIENEITQINSQIELLKKNNSEQEQEIQEKNTMINSEIEKQKQVILEKCGQIDIDNNKLTEQLENLQNDINNTKLQMHSLELDKNNIIPKLEKLAEMEENLQELNDKEENLIRDNAAIEYAKEVLEIAYKKMKENITPIFTQNLSKNIEKITNGKYKNVKINDEEGILIERDNGEYVSSEKLSEGTIDQLYLSLRFGAIKELTQENMPIILDEAFAYYDEERLENILKYINSEFKDNQIIIFTCTEREKQILDKEKIQYNFISL